MQKIYLVICDITYSLGDTERDILYADISKESAEREARQLNEEEEQAIKPEGVKRTYRVEETTLFK